MHAFNPGTQKAEVGESFGGQLGIYSEIFSLGEKKSVFPTTTWHLKDCPVPGPRKRHSCGWPKTPVLGLRVEASPGLGRGFRCE